MTELLSRIGVRLRRDGLAACTRAAAETAWRALSGGVYQRPNTVDANRRMWEHWDWKRKGEEWTPSEEWKTALVREVLEPSIPMGSRGLEIGPGAGRWTAHLISRAAQVTAVDVTPRCIQECSSRFIEAKNLRLVLNDGKDLSFMAPSSIDRIWSFDVFVHIASDDVRSYISQCGSILAPGGRGIIHHAANGRRAKGWRSDMTAEKMVEFCVSSGLVVVDQFTTWEAGRFHISSGIDPSADIITVFERPLHEPG